MKERKKGQLLYARNTSLNIILNYVTSIVNTNIIIQIRVINLFPGVLHSYTFHLDFQPLQKIWTVEQPIQLHPFQL